MTRRCTSLDQAWTRCCFCPAAAARMLHWLLPALYVSSKPPIGCLEGFSTLLPFCCNNKDDRSYTPTPSDAYKNKQSTSIDLSSIPTILLQLSVLGFLLPSIAPCSATALKAVPPRVPQALRLAASVVFHHPHHSSTYAQPYNTATCRRGQSHAGTAQTCACRQAQACSSPCQHSQDRHHGAPCHRLQA